jgi:uncharacterized membrane protein YwaF
VRNESVKLDSHFLIIRSCVVSIKDRVSKGAVSVLTGRKTHCFKLCLLLFFCSLQTVVIPIAAFSKGRLREAALDFIFVFGILGAFFGTYFAGNNYSSYPVVCIDNTVSAITHTVAGFASLYIVISGMQSMKKRNISLNIAILTAFSVIAYIVGALIPYNYMFLFSHDGTPYQIFYDLVNGNKVLYPIIVVVLFYLYILVFYLVYVLIEKKLAKKKLNLNN